MPSDQPNAAISFSAVSKSFTSDPVLKSINVQIESNRITVIVGRSGCGKSTLLKLINGLCLPDEGCITIAGQPIDYTDLPALRTRIGYAVQGSGLFPHLTAAENISLLARVVGWNEQGINARLQELLPMAQLETGILGRYPHQLSGGQQQRVGLCRALLLNPPLLLLDEPFAALDPLTRLDVQQQLLALQQGEPRTCVLVTHDMAEALRLADDILVMGGGGLLAKTNSAELQRENPQLDADHLLLSMLEEIG